MVKLTCILCITVLLAEFSCTGVPSRGFLAQDALPPPGFGAYGYLILTGRPAASQQKRYEAICDAWMRNLEPAEEMRTANRQSLMVTFWPLQTQNDVAGASKASCKQLVKKYGYGLAAQIAASVGKQGLPGPFLVAWAAPWRPDSSRGNALILDLSSFSDEDLDRAFGLWKSEIARNPQEWNKTFDLALFREKFRNLIQTYGDQIVAVVR